jgi:hypothetical protein
VIQHGNVHSRPDENVLFIIQVWCPESSWREHRDTMGDILASLQIAD